MGAHARDLKSFDRKVMPVRFRPRAPSHLRNATASLAFTAEMVVEAFHQTAIAVCRMDASSIWRNQGKPPFLDFPATRLLHNKFIQSGFV